MLVREVQARSTRIYGDANRPPRADDAKTVWEEVTNIVNQVCPDCKEFRRKITVKCWQQRRQHFTVILQSSYCEMTLQSVVISLTKTTMKMFINGPFSRTRNK